MTPELYQRLKPLYSAALELPAPRRASFVAEACQGDPELEAELEAILAAHDTEAGVLDVPIISFENHSLGAPRSFFDGDVILGRFKIVRYIAAGGMGEVYEAQDLFLQDLHVALKTIRPAIAGEPEWHRRFKREVVLAREVSHPNLCPIYDIFQCDEPPPGLLFLTMKLLPGGTLTSLIRSDEAISNEEKETIAKQIGLGLAAIHAAGIVHGDIKPNNIMLDRNARDLRVWITDFGLARAFETDSTVSIKPTVAGTPGYVAPEIYQGQPPSQASDLFAYGVVLHELFTGRKPAPSPDSSTYLSSPLVGSSGAPAYCAELIAECLQRDPARRCRAFEQALEKMGARRSGREFWTRRRFLATAAVSAGVAATGAWWKWDFIEDELHPLPQRRFVALLNWPRTADDRPIPLLTGVLSAIKSELARAEAFDRNFFVISPEDVQQDLSAAAERLIDICDPLGANLVLAASELHGPKHSALFLRLLDPRSGGAVREKRLTYSHADLTSLPGKAVRAAGSLLGVGQYLQGTPRGLAGTQSSEAFAAFQAAEALMKQQNDAGLDAALEKYKQAVASDPNYALAHAKLALAYITLYGRRPDPGALDLARRNCEHALALEPSLFQGRLARSLVLEETGNQQGALNELAQARALDPTDPQTLLAQARIYVRMNRWADAQQTYERLLNQRPNFWVIYNSKAYALDKQGRYREAVEALRSATLAAPGNCMAMANLGGEYSQIGEFAYAAECSKKSMALRPNGLAAANASLALRCQGRYREALPFALKAVELAPHDDTNWLELGDCYLSLGRRSIEARSAYERAEKVAEEQLQTDASDGSEWMSLALYRAKSGNLQDVLSLVQRAEKLGALDMVSQLCKIRILELLGKRDEALRTLAVCFGKGATGLQILPFPELGPLRRDPRYIQMAHALPADIRATGQLTSGTKS
jgi:tetratricopeptide (TPR) repeat protein